MVNESKHVYPYIPIQAYVVFCPVKHIIDVIFLLLSITGIILQFTLLRTATTTDEARKYCNVASYVTTVYVGSYVCKSSS